VIQVMVDAGMVGRSPADQNGHPGTAPVNVLRASDKAGLPPGSLVYVGDRAMGEFRLVITAYGPGGYTERQLSDIGQAFPLDPSWPVTWIDVIGFSSVETVQEIGARFGVHPLILEDILNTRGRPKLEVFNDHLYIAIKAISVEDGDADLRVEQVSLILGRDYVCTLQEGPDDLFGPVRDRIRRDGRIRHFGPDYLAYALVDVIVDGYFSVLERLDQRVEVLEEQVLEQPTPPTLKEIHSLKRAMVDLRHILWPVRELVLSLERADSSLLGKNVAIFFRDIYEHTVQMIETIESLRDVVAGMLDIYLSSVSFRLNQVMKLLTIFSTIFMPLTFLVGVYGMNFEYMPELGLPWAYPLLWLVMVAIAAGMLVWFRGKRWI